MIELKEWIEDGITIRKTNSGYQVFTIPINMILRIMKILLK